MTDESIPIELRLAMAYPHGAPPSIRRFFVEWEYPQRSSAFAAKEAARNISREISTRAAQAVAEAQELKARLLELESDAESLSRMSAIRDESRDICARLNLPPSSTEDDSLSGGSVAETTIEALRRDVERAEASASNWQSLSSLADVIAGVARPTDRLARKLALSGAWEICPPIDRRGRAAARREAEEHERNASPEREAERRRIQARIAAIENRQRLEAV